MKTFLLIDANALIHRSFHALPPLTTPDGRAAGALYGLSSTLLKTLKDQPPEYIAAAFDRPEPTFRDEIFDDYKAHRPPAAQELIDQIIAAHELFKRFGITTFEQPGFEADDIIGTLVQQFKTEKDLRVVILTGDLDTLQLVENDKVLVQTMKKGVSETVLYNEEAVKLRYNLSPLQLPDYKGLVGDPSDNIPGVLGIGPKSASKLLNEYQTLENVYAHLSVLSDVLHKKLAPQKEQALLSKKLAIIRRDVPIETNLETLKFDKIDPVSLVNYFNKLGFESLIKRFDKINTNETDNGTVDSRSMIETSDIIVVTDEKDAREKIKSITTDDGLKVAFDWKSIIKNMESPRLAIKPPIFDIQIAGWLLDPDQKDFSIKALSRRLLKKSVLDDLYPSKNAVVDLFLFLDKKIKSYELDHVFKNIEMPLIPILAAMERSGIAVHTKTLSSLKNALDSELSSLTSQIYKEAGEEFNINSPQQVAHILFEVLGLKPKKRAGSGHHRTDKEVLSTLVEKHPIISLMLNYREDFKIKTAFIEPLIKSIEEDGRIRTTFLQTGTATGRLASEKPNLQNIPQESKWSKEIRKAFEATPGYTLLSFDYSQLELRVLAHLSNDKNLIRAFCDNRDIHQHTASKVFNVSLDQVTPAMRRTSKTLNFGIVYGMGVRAFSRESGFNLDEAERFMDEYFMEFPTIKEWQDRIKADAQTFGYIKNENGRRRWFIKMAGNGLFSGEFERAAINMPIQSLGADILKLAMIKIAAMVKKNDWNENILRLLLTIHDELLFEVRDDMLKIIALTINKIAEEAYPLNVPLVVEAKHGKNWGMMSKLSVNAS
ncbi:hypothetical protein HY967_01955 [Candidatus Jorgensenbacteria bacterium]|nr:hypothetical protein [Candidatus Jorgensenbacteria bacterium]